MSLTVKPFTGFSGSLRAAARGLSSSKSQQLPKNVDVAIIGGGITGSALLYSLAEFTDLDKVLLVERRPEFARVASGPNNNSQTIHCGDIETNYTPAKAATVKRQADMLRNFVTKLPHAEQTRTAAKMQKMAIGVGDAECTFMEKRFHDFKHIFPNMKLLGRDQIAKVEPSVIYSNMQTRTMRPENVVANYVADEHSGIDYFHTTNNFVKLAQNIGESSKRYLKAATNTEMKSIVREDDGYRVATNRGDVKAKFVVVSSCGYSLLTAHRMGYAHHLSCLPVAGSFYFGPKILQGKVYCVQNPLLPFAAVHGDPDLIADRQTRFGPTALPLPLLERYQYNTFLDFLRVIRPSAGLAKVYFDLLSNSTMRNYFLKNLLFEVPKLNVRLFAKDVQKIIPSIKSTDLHYAEGFGGVRPQIVDKKNKKLLLGEGKVDPADDPIVFNVTPSPGATTCLGTAEGDMRKIARFLNCQINEAKFAKTLLEGEYPCHTTASSH